MSHPTDTLYRERAEKRRRKMILGLAFAFSVLCLGLFVTSLFRDDCTGSFERSPQAIARRYVEALRNGDLNGVQACWEHFAYFDLETGCSEICIQRIAGRPFALQGIEILDAMHIQDGRARLSLQVTVTCGEQSAPLQGVLTLDSVARSLPWRHWRIVHSTLGGQLSALWCENAR